MSVVVAWCYAVEERNIAIFFLLVSTYTVYLPLSSLSRGDRVYGLPTCSVHMTVVWHVVSNDIQKQIQRHICMYRNKDAHGQVHGCATTSG